MNIIASTPCFVRVDDREKRKEVIQRLIEGRGAPASISDDCANPILCGTDYWLEFNMLNTNPKYLIGYINCGTNIPLFLALAGMRSDTDRGQWFRRIGGPEGANMFKCRLDNFDHERAEMCRNGFFRRATVVEIIKHFNMEEE